MFETMVAEIREEAVRYCYNVTVKTGVERRQVILRRSGKEGRLLWTDLRRERRLKAAGTCRDRLLSRRIPESLRLQKRGSKVGRNDPLPLRLRKEI